MNMDFKNAISIYTKAAIEDLDEYGLMYQPLNKGLKMFRVDSENSFHLAPGLRRKLVGPYIELSNGWGAFTRDIFLN
jgi:hypothetical protein